MQGMQGDETSGRGHREHVEPATLRDVAGRFPTGVAVITTELDGRPYGFSANAFCSLSLEPPLVLVCAARTSSTRPALVASGGFGINILAADQEDLCRTFARKVDDRFAGVAVSPSPLGHPVLEGALAYLDCSLHSLLPGGDHVIFTGLVTATEARDGDALMFYAGAFGRAPAPIRS